MVELLLGNVEVLAHSFWTWEGIGCMQMVGGTVILGLYSTLRAPSLPQGKSLE